MQWIKLTDRTPNPDEHGRVLIYTEGYDFNGEQVFDVKTETLNECFYVDPDDQSEVCKVASHWMPHPANTGAPNWTAEQKAPFTCKYCGRPSWIDPSDQSPPPDYCHEIDHGTSEDRALFGSGTSEP